MSAKRSVGSEFERGQVIPSMQKVQATTGKKGATIPAMQPVQGQTSQQGNQGGGSGSSQGGKK